MPCDPTQEFMMLFASKTCMQSNKIVNVEVETPNGRMTVQHGSNPQKSPKFLLLGEVFHCARIFLARIIRRHSLKRQHTYLNTHKMRVVGVGCFHGSLSASAERLLGQGAAPSPGGGACCACRCPLLPALPPSAPNLMRRWRDWDSHSRDLLSCPS